MLGRVRCEGHVRALNNGLAPVRNERFRVVEREFILSRSRESEVTLEAPRRLPVEIFAVELVGVLADPPTALEL